MRIYDHGEVAPPDPRMATDAACIGHPTAMFFPPKGGSVVAAKKVCAGCPVREPCLEYALVNHQHIGIWGGTSGKERRTMKREVAA